MTGKVHQIIQTSRTLKHIVLIATPQTYFVNSAFLFPCWLRVVQYTQSDSIRESSRRVESSTTPDESTHFNVTF